MNAKPKVSIGYLLEASLYPSMFLELPMWLLYFPESYTYREDIHLEWEEKVRPIGGMERSGDNVRQKCQGWSRLLQRLFFPTIVSQ